MRMFSPFVIYRQSNGTVLNYSRLTEDVEKQMRVIPAIQISRIRESCEQSDNTVVEVLTQNTTMTATAFFLITRILEMSKSGKYVWTNTADGWRISEVEILKDKLESHWALGFVKPRRVF
jgi:flavorubredoxin